MKVLVMQTEIGDGILKTNRYSRDQLEKLSRIINSSFKPSVENWAAKFGYDYKLITSYSGHAVFPLDDDNSLGLNYAAERYFHFDNEYDVTVYFDLDIQITREAPPIPQVKGVMAVDVGEFMKPTRENFIRHYPMFGSNIRYVNSGVIMADRDGGRRLKDFFLKRINEPTPSRLMDEFLLNEYFNLFGKEVGYLTHEWNFMPGMTNSPTGRPFVIHHSTHLAKASLISLVK